MAYNDGPFTAGVAFSGSVTDPARTPADHGRRRPPTRHTRVGRRAEQRKQRHPRDQHFGRPRDGRAIRDHGRQRDRAHGIELASVNAANMGTVRYNLIHDTPGDGIRLTDADSVVDVYNNLIFNTNVGIRLLADLSPAARVNVFGNTVSNTTTAGIASRDASKSSCARRARG